MKLVREGTWEIKYAPEIDFSEDTWEIKYAPGPDFPFLIIYTTNTGKHVIVDGFQTVEAATRGLNEIFAQLSDRQQVFVA